MKDTICAVATLVGESSINVIRISGQDAIKIVNKIFDKDLLKKESHTITYGFIVENSEKIDEVLVSVFKSPKSFTTEDIVEINVHGGNLSVSKVMELLISNGARLAEPGEFLKRAFLNGRIDLTQAEAVGDLINAQTEGSRKMALKGIDKSIYSTINELKQKKYYIILADYLDNPPAKKEADCFMQVSTLDEQAIYDIAKTEQVDTIITACTDQALLTVANVSEKLHMPFYLSKACAESVTNKFYMKQRFEENNIPTAMYKLYENKIDKEEFQKFNDFPYVVKPCDCNSSKGVKKVENIEQLKGAVDTAFSLSRSSKIVVEKYLSGYEISIDIWVKEYEPLILDVTKTNKMNAGTGAFTIYQSFYSIDDISYDLQHQIYEISKKIKGNVGKLFFDASKQMQLDFAGEVWEKCISNSNLGLLEDDKEALKSLGKLLGSTDIEGQIRQIRLVNTFLDGQIEDATESRNKNEKMYKKLGVIVGLAVVIVLA